ncbi:MULTISPECIES: Bax inhibitor-1/YccA family protein [Kordiimonas]|uniref:Bax inhibitor-1/YccA family protein n=1 Tax=Kordiimonas TaxID=288021 RepID=UPI001FF1C82A|nr:MULTISPECIES: Bax inhibitor-1/YccA family protein [Kordiimonas]MCK0069211.1 Bax inhibitor-1/YccA family protein [Kordiimonas laminariae]UTW58544.1 Bax inhibitor-1/YccA family protein [Kordiimonas sp. SCSIO 12603]
MERYNTAYRAGTATQTAEFDAGLRAYMLKVYNYMASGVLLTGIIAMIVGTNQDLMVAIYGGGLRWIVALAPLAFILVMSFGAHRMSSGTLQMVFWAFAAVMGLSMASIFAVYSAESIARTFFITAASFGALSLYGYTTKKSLSGMGTFLFMGLIGIIIASIVNFFLASSMMAFVINVAGVLIFAGLTAYDTQRIKESYFMTTTGEAVAKGAIMGAVNLYLDFVNLFMFLLNFLGERE